MFSLQCFHQATEPTYTAATYELTTGVDLQADRTSRRSRGNNSYSRSSRSCTRIHRRISLRSFPTSSGRCLGRMCWTQCGRGSGRSWTGCYPSTQTLSTGSWTTPTRLWTYYTRRSTSFWGSYVTAGQPLACSGRSSSADWAGRCPASSCHWSRWNRVYTPPTNCWRGVSRCWRSAGWAKESSCLYTMFI